MWTWRWCFITSRFIRRKQLCTCGQNMVASSVMQASFDYATTRNIMDLNTYKFSRSPDRSGWIIINNNLHRGGPTLPLEIQCRYDCRTEANRRLTTWRCVASVSKPGKLTRTQEGTAKGLCAAILLSSFSCTDSASEPHHTLSTSSDDQRLPLLLEHVEF